LSILSETWVQLLKNNKRNGRNVELPFTLLPFRRLINRLNRLNQYINRTESQKRIMMDQLDTTSQELRRARVRSLIQIGGLLERAGTLDVFNIPLGMDLQKDPSVKNNIAALFKSLLITNNMVTSHEFDLNVLTLQGLEAFKRKGTSGSRPLELKKIGTIE
jgi:hypothetical protein